MTISDLGALGEFFGLFAVVASLWYLAIQTRGSNAVALAETHRALVASLNRVWSRLEQDRELLRLVRIGANDWSHLSRNDQAAVHAFLSQLFSTLSVAWEQRSLAPDDQFVLAWEDVLLGVILCPGAQIWWREAQYLYPGALVSRLNARLETSDNLPPSWVDGTSWWATEDADFLDR